MCRLELHDTKGANKAGTNCSGIPARGYSSSNLGPLLQAQLSCRSWLTCNKAETDCSGIPARGYSSSNLGLLLQAAGPGFLSTDSLRHKKLLLSNVSGRRSSCLPKTLQSAWPICSSQKTFSLLLLPLFSLAAFKLNTPFHRYISSITRQSMLAMLAYQPTNTAASPGSS